MEYEEITEAQNAGTPCVHCYSLSGHYVFCGLINRNAGEEQIALSEGLSTGDVDALHALGVKWDGDNR